ncbi:MAG: ribonuclease P protein component [Verrucomicrobia bacterium]|nr:ribonuclease P protein component [Verrucomicrobiota bacterium]
MPNGPMPARTALRLTRASRLKQGRDFTRLKTKGQRLGCGCLILNWLAGSEGARGRLGVVTSRKVGCAVARSRARRLLREVWRQNQHDFPAALDMVLVARPSIAGKKLAAVNRDFRTGLRRAGLFQSNEPRPEPAHA